MNREAIEKRLAELRKALEQIEANGNATLGAIAECEYWLRQLENDPDEPESFPPDERD